MTILEGSHLVRQGKTSLILILGVDSRSEEINTFTSYMKNQQAEYTCESEIGKYMKRMLHCFTFPRPNGWKLKFKLDQYLQGRLYGGLEIRISHVYNNAVVKRDK